MRRMLMGFALALVAAVAWAADSNANATDENERWSDTSIWATRDGYASGASSWDLFITPNGLAYINVLTAPASGQVQGRYFLGAEDVSALSRIAQAQRFQELPSRIGSSLGQSVLGLTIQTAGKTKSVQVNEGAPPSPELTRFLAVWNAVWAQVPLKPRQPFNAP